MKRTMKTLWLGAPAFRRLLRCLGSLVLLALSPSLVAAEALYLIDFDRGRQRRPGEAWQLANLQRLRRSLVKLGAAAQGEAVFEETLWKPLMYRYERTLRA